MIYERYDGYAPRDRLQRASRGALVFGVCAGVADRFGFDRGVTRILTAIAALIFFPAVLIGYVALAILLKKSPEPTREGSARRSSGRTRPHARMRAEQHEERLRDLDRRMQRLEAYLTSRRFKLEREFEKLKD